MNVLIGCDVDPVLPADGRTTPSGDPWEPLERIPLLLAAIGDDLPRITWLIRCDESVRLATGHAASGYRSRRALWDRLRERGHELGWHMHLLSLDPAGRRLAFDPAPNWLEEAHAGLSAEFPVRATRTGWDYGSNDLLGRLDASGIRLDFSALPGHKVWYAAHGGPVVVDWLRCPREPYHPSRRDYQRPGADALALLEVPLATFRNPVLEMPRRWVWRVLHGCLTPRGLGSRTRLITEPWPELPRPASGVWAFHFHPVDLTDEGISNFARNVARLASEAQARFVTASELVTERARPS